MSYSSHKIWASQEQAICWRSICWMNKWINMWMNESVLPALGRLPGIQQMWNKWLHTVAQTCFYLYIITLIYVSSQIYHWAICHKSKSTILNALLCQQRVQYSKQLSLPNPVLSLEYPRTWTVPKKPDMWLDSSYHYHDVIQVLRVYMYLFLCHCHNIKQNPHPCHLKLPLIF